MLHIQTFSLIAFISLVASNIIVIDQYKPNINEYHCAPNESCTIGCLSSHACSGTTLHCPANRACTVMCDGRSTTATNTCFNSTIHAEHSTHLSITITAHQSNAESMTIYAPYTNHKQSILTCNSGANNLNQCKNIELIANEGFDDIRLRCNDSSYLCFISGSMSCAYGECTTLQYKNTQIGYQCLHNFSCVAVASTITPISTSMASQNVLPYEMYAISTPKEKDIHSLVLVIVGTITICCVVLILLAMCGVFYVRFNRENVEKILLKRYISGRGTSNLRFKASDVVDSNETSNETSNASNNYSVNSSELGLSLSNTLNLKSKAKYMDDIDINIDSHNPLFLNRTPDIDASFSSGDSLTVLGESQSASMHSSISEDYDDDGSDIYAAPFPVFAPLKKCEPILTAVLTEKQKEIHEENIRNRGKCYGYSQPEILFEEDEDYTDDSTIATHENANNNKHNVALNDKDCSDSDDLLEDGAVVNDLQIIKIQNVNIPVPDPEIMCDDDGCFPNLPPHASIHYGNSLTVNGVAFHL